MPGAVCLIHISTSPPRERAVRARKHLLDDGGRDDVRHVSFVRAGGDLEVHVRVKSPDSGKVHVPAEYRDADVVGGANVLEALDEVFTLLLMSRRGPVIVFRLGQPRWFSDITSRAATLT